MAVSQTPDNKDVSNRALIALPFLLVALAPSALGQGSYYNNAQQCPTTVTGWYEQVRVFFAQLRIAAKSKAGGRATLELYNRLQECRTIETQAPRPPGSKSVLTSTLKECFKKIDGFLEASGDVRGRRFGLSVTDAEFEEKLKESQRIKSTQFPLFLEKELRNTNLEQQIRAADLKTPQGKKATEQVVQALEKAAQRAIKENKEDIEEVVIFPYESRKIPAMVTLKDEPVFSRIVMLIKGKPDQFGKRTDKVVQFIPETSPQVSMISQTYEKGKERGDVVFQDFFRNMRKGETRPHIDRTYGGDGSGMNTAQNCNNCHAAGVLNIIPRAETFDLKYIDRLKAFNSYFDPYTAKKVDVAFSFPSDVKGPGIGPVLKKGDDAALKRRDQVLEQCLASDSDQLKQAKISPIEYRKQIATAMNCSSCHDQNQSHYPLKSGFIGLHLSSMDQLTEYVVEMGKAERASRLAKKHGQTAKQLSEIEKMEKMYSMPMAEDAEIHPLPYEWQRKTLVKCLKLEYLGSDESDPKKSIVGSLEDYLFEENRRNGICPDPSPEDQIAAMSEGLLYQNRPRTDPDSAIYPLGHRPEQAVPEPLTPKGPKAGSAEQK